MAHKIHTGEYFLALAFNVSVFELHVVLCEGWDLLGSLTSTNIVVLCWMVLALVNTFNLGKGGIEILKHL